MLKLNQNYSDYTDETDENYPEGKAVNASSSESYDGTPLLAEFMNDVNAAHIAMYEKAHGSRDGIDGQPDTQKASQFADSVAKYTDDKVKAHADKRGLTDGVHGATSEATPGQIVSRDEFGRAKFGAPVDDTDAVRKVDVDKTIEYFDELVEGTKKELSAHKEDTNNPHKVTKEQVGLGDVPNLAPVAQGSKTSTAPIQAKAATGIAYGVICNTEATVQNKEVNINGFILEAGAVVRVLFANANSAANPTLNVSFDGSTFTGAKAIKAVKAGQKIVPPVHSGKWRGAEDYTDEMWQPYTTLELIYDGIDWVIMGNPEFENWSNDTEGYTVLANGLITQRLSSYAETTTYGDWIFRIIFKNNCWLKSVPWANTELGISFRVSCSSKSLDRIKYYLFGGVHYEFEISGY